MTLNPVRLSEPETTSLAESAGRGGLTCRQHGHPLLEVGKRGDGVQQPEHVQTIEYKSKNIPACNCFRLFRHGHTEVFTFSAGDVWVEPAGRRGQISHQVSCVVDQEEEIN